MVDVWEDEASFVAFGSVIGPATTAAGLDAWPHIHRVAGIVTTDGRRLAAAR